MVDGGIVAEKEIGRLERLDRVEKRLDRLLVRFGLDEEVWIGFVVVDDSGSLKGKSDCLERLDWLDRIEERLDQLSVRFGLIRVLLVWFGYLEGSSGRFGSARGEG
ncbi:unnamed protein product [Dovyalis caffra]|uniref:Uncharacterized protein n=1 Tax=Dovyalis caffra TaxID=77055 RepID=A0AAV1S796_9ROSI|nr:unnamed protein product [Dovyalis caffra]